MKITWKVVSILLFHILHSNTTISMPLKMASLLEQPNFSLDICNKKRGMNSPYGESIPQTHYIHVFLFILIYSRKQLWCNQFSPSTMRLLINSPTVTAPSMGLSSKTMKYANLLPALSAHLLPHVILFLLSDPSRWDPFVSSKTVIPLFKTMMKSG